MSLLRQTHGYCMCKCARRCAALAPNLPPLPAPIRGQTTTASGVAFAQQNPCPDRLCSWRYEGSLPCWNGQCSWQPQRRVATRYDKLAANYLAFIKLASIRIWLRTYESTP
jgi:hypothetical protein